MSLCRSRDDFTDRERQLLHSLRPIMASTLAHLHEVAILRAVADDRGGSHEVVLFDARKVVAWASPVAAEAFDLVVGAPLPATLQRCLVADGNSDRTGSRATVVDGLGRRLRIRLVEHAYPGLDAVHFTPAGAPPIRGCCRTTSD